jgi:hypothetical protein
MAPLSLRWRGSGRAEALAFGRDELAVRSTVAAAPGTPLEGELEVPGGDPLPLTVKVRRCRREPEGTFRIEGRLISPTRALREALGQGVDAPDAGAKGGPEGGALEPARDEAGRDRGER